MPAFMWKEKSYVGVNHLLSRDHHEDNTADFSVHIALVQVLPLAYFLLLSILRKIPDLICTGE